MTLAAAHVHLLSKSLTFDLAAGVRARLCAERSGVFDERGAGNCEELLAEGSSTAEYREAYRLLYAGGGRHARQFQGEESSPCTLDGDVRIPVPSVSLCCVEAGSPESVA